MRPLRLELEGFTAYRERIEVDFSGAELFVLSGATGAGKSSLIDAMGFALYGSVPRYNDPKLVHPVISQGKLEARVRFEFAMDGKTYTAVRVVRRTKQGATTREARLECGGRVLAGSPGELDREIRRIFGLSFDQFTTCVVLPQGEFARFLHDKPADRQELLKELLGLRLYDRTRQLAVARENGAKQQMARLEGRLQEFAGATPEARRAAFERMKRLKKLSTEVEKMEATIDGLQKSRAELTATAARGEQQAALLEGCKVPAGLDALSRTGAEASGERERATGALERVERDLAEAERERAALPALGDLQAQVRAHTERAERAGRLERVEQEERVARQRSDAASSAAETATRQLEEATQSLASIERAHAAHALAADLVPGEPCPVCLRELTARPVHRRPPGLAAAERARESAEKVSSSARAAENEAMRLHVESATRAAALREELSLLDESLARAPEPEALERSLTEVAAAEARIERARKTLLSAREAERAARKNVEDLKGRVAEAWRRYDVERDRLAALGPPAAVREDLAGSWAALSGWAAAQARSKRAEVEAVSVRGREVARECDEASDRLTAVCRDADLPIGKEAARDRVIREIARVQGELDSIDTAFETSKRLAAELEAARATQAVAHALAQHLSASGFERWLLQEAFHRLVLAASERLRDLTAGGYSLQLDERSSFEIVDHHNAGEPRSARTLSGGETFLASLALALALADQISGLAEQGAARLDSMFLDEGFGALDQDTLETVAATLEELGARGRVIGLVTHVRELAERIPVQFRVSKGPTTALVERISS